MRNSLKTDLGHMLFKSVLGSLIPQQVLEDKRHELNLHHTIIPYFINVYSM